MKGNFFERCAGRSSFVIVGDRLYQFCDRISCDRLQIGEDSVGLIRGPSIVEIEKFEFARRKSEVDAFMKEYASKTLKADLKTLQERNSDSSIDRCLNFILFEALPLMIDTAYELGNLLGVVPKVPKSGKEVMEELVAKEGTTTVDKRSKARVLKADFIKSLNDRKYLCFTTKAVHDSVLGTAVLGGNDVYVAEGYVYALTSGSGPFIVSERQFNLRADSCQDVKNVANNYGQALNDKLCLRAVEACSEQDLEDSVVDVVNPFASKTEFSYGNLGYNREGDVFYLWYRIPPFVMQNPCRPNVYHPFKGTRIGVRVNWSDGRVWQEGHAVIVDPTIHPFLRNWNGGYQGICILDNRDYGDTAEGVVKQLSRGISAYMNGLTIDSLKAHGSLKENESRYFDRNLKYVFDVVGSMSREEAVAKGFMITNEWILEPRVSS